MLWDRILTVICLKSRLAPNIKAILVPEWKEDVAKVIAGDKASAQEKFWERSDSIAWNVDSLHSKYLAVLQVLQV